MILDPGSKKVSHLPELREHRAIDGFVRDLLGGTTAQVFADALPHITWVSGPQGGVRLYNSRFFDYTGLTPETVDELAWVKTVHPDDLPAMMVSRRESLETGAPWQVEYRLRGADGTYRWFLGRASLVRDARGEGIVWIGSATDISPLKEAGHRLDTLFTSSVIGVIYWSLANRRVIDMNDTFLGMVGYTREDLARGRLDWEAMTPPEWQECGQRGLDILRTGGTAAPYEKEYLRRDGTRLPVLVAISRLADSEEEAISLIVDLSEQKKTEDALRLSEERYRLLTLTTNEIVWWTDARGAIVRETPSWEGFTGQNRAAYFNWGWRDAVHPDDQSRMTRTWLSALERKSHYKCEYRLRHNDGSYRTVLARGTPIIARDGTIVEWICAGVDVTEQRDQERRDRFLADLLERLRPMQDLETMVWEMERSIGSFLNLSRVLYADIDTPENQIIIYGDFCADGVASMVGRWPLAAWGEGALQELRQGRTLIVEDASADVRLCGDIEADPASTWTQAEVVANITVPLLRDEEWVAAFSFQQRMARQWRPEDIALLETIATRTWVVLEQGRLREQEGQIARKNKRIAETLQRAMLITPTSHQFRGLEIATRYEAAWDEALVGGDFYDVFSYWGEQVCFVVGDVAGKGLEAAAHTAEVKFALRAFLHDNPDPAHALTRLNNFLCKERQEDPTVPKDDFRQSFVTLALALVNVASGDVVLAAAGSDPPLIHRAAFGKVEEAAIPNIVLGAKLGAGYTTQTVRLTPGDTLVFTTDGITEARNMAREFFGSEGLEAAVHAAVTDAASMDEAADGIIARAKLWGGDKLRDDFCLLLARFTGQ